MNQSVMTQQQVAVPTTPPVAIPVREILPWAIFFGLLLSMVIYFIGTGREPSR